MQGQVHNLKGPTLLASNGAVHDEILELFREIFNSQYRHPIPGMNL